MNTRFEDATVCCTFFRKQGIFLSERNTVIEGRVIVRLGKAIKIRKMTLRFEGKSKVHYTTSSGNQQEFHSNKEIFFDTRFVLLEPSPPHEASVLLQLGEFSYPFQFQLPPNLCLCAV